MVKFLNDIPGEQTTTKKKPSLEESFLKLMDTLISPSTNPWSILTKIQRSPFSPFLDSLSHSNKS